MACRVRTKTLAALRYLCANELILWLLWIGYAKNAEKHKKLLILAHFLSNKGIELKMTKN